MNSKVVALNIVEVRKQETMTDLSPKLGRKHTVKGQDLLLT